MKTTFLAAVAVLLMATAAAHAITKGFSCDTPNVYLDDIGKTSITSTAIQFNYMLDIWSIQHFLSDGTTVFREAQYQIKDESNNGGKMQWTGTHRRNSQLVMLGEIKQEAGKPVYFEWLWDRDKLIMNMGAFCKNIGDAPDPQWPNWLFNDPPAVRVLRVR